MFLLIFFGYLFTVLFIVGISLSHVVAENFILYLCLVRNKIMTLSTPPVFCIRN